MSATVTRLGSITPDDLAGLCREAGARVELDGTTYRVYPAESTAAPIFFSSLRLQTDSAMLNKLSDLRKAGIDIRAMLTAKARPKTTTKTTTQEEPPVTAAAQPRDISPTITRREAGELRDMCRKVIEANDALAGMLAEAERRIVAQGDRLADQGAAIDELRAEIRHLRGGAPAPAPKPPSRAEIIRGAVLAFYMDHPRMKITPGMVEANIGDDLPADRQTNAVGQACKELAKAGKLHGGATRDTPAAKKGLYWYEPPAETGEDGEQQQ